MASSSPPDLRMAEPNGAAHVFSQTSTAAALPGSSECADLLDVLLGEQDREVALQRAQLADLTVVGVAQLRRLDRAVFGLHDHHQVEHPDRVAVDQRLQLGRHLAREVRLLRRESDHEVVDRPEFIDVDVGHGLLQSCGSVFRRPLLDVGVVLVGREAGFFPGAEPAVEVGDVLVPECLQGECCERASCA